MKTLLLTIFVLLVAISVLGFYRGWFYVSTDRMDQKPNATITVDKDKIHADEEKAKEKLRGLRQE